MSSLATLDAAIFRFVNLTLSNPVLDWLMPVFSSNAFFFPCALVLAAIIAWKGGTRARLCLVLLILAVALGDNWICNAIKKAVARPRPFVTLKDARIRPPPDPAKQEDDVRKSTLKERENTTQLVASGSHRSMPSGHSANWFAATMVAFIYYRRSVRFMLPMAIAVAFSRVYNGVHYPSDVLAGAILGAGYAACGIWALDSAWQWLGKRWFPLWWQQLPSILNPEVGRVTPCAPAPVAGGGGAHGVTRPTTSATDLSPPGVHDPHWLRLGYLLILVVLCARIGYIASDTIELSQDEAYQWLWAKDPAFSIISLPPLIALTQWVGTSLWGDTELGVRFFAPVLAAVLSFILMRFIARTATARAGFLLILILQAIPLVALGSTLLTVDLLLTLFWTLAMIAGWGAMQRGSPARDWLWVGLWMGLALLSKNTAWYLLVCWPIYFVLWQPGRIQLRRPGFYAALLVSLLLFLPGLLWSARHDWVTIGQVAIDAEFDQVWRPALARLGEFIGMAVLLWNPIFFAATMWAAIAFWRRDKNNPLLIYFFSMGASVFLAGFLNGFHGQVQVNWVAPAILPLLSLMIIFWEKQAGAQFRWIKPVLALGLIGGLFAVVLMHETRLISKITGLRLPGNQDPLRHVRAWKETAQAVNEARLELAREGPPVFILAGNQGVASELSFYLPEAKAGVPSHPLVYCPKQTKPMDEVGFWAGYGNRKGQNAIYVEADVAPRPPPPRLGDQFESVTLLGSREIKYRGRVFRRLQLFACRNLR